MKLAKRLFALALVLCMVFCLSVAVFADGGETTPTETTETKTFEDAKAVTITKIYKVQNADTSAPAEDFELEVDNEGAPVTVTDSQLTTANAPKIQSSNITKAEFKSATTSTDDSATAMFTITLPEYTHVGVYTYELHEKAGTTAGTTYHADKIRLVVTVIEQNGRVRVAAVHTEEEGGSKTGSITNVYKAGTLKVAKTVKGTLGDTQKYFEFKVTLTGEQGKTYGDSYAVSGGSNSENPSTIKIGEQTTFKLKHDETLSIANLPYGVVYTVTETAVDGYTTTKTGESGTIKDAEQTAAFTNTKDGDIDTGVYMDSLPYILALAVAFGGAVVMFTRKRHVED